MAAPASAPATRPVGTLFCLLLATTSPVRATDSDTVVVTATRTERPLGDTLAAVTVLTREDIDRVQARSVEELLRGIAGIDHDNAGGFGKATSIFLRGTESDHVVVLVDGIRFGSPTLGIAAFEHLPIDRLERIEIVRGPRSALYGPDAIGGVIQFITRGRRDGLHLSAQTGYGSHDTRRLSAGLDAQAERAWLSVGATDFVTDGINACAGRPFPPGGGCFTHEPDRDGYDNESLSVRAGVRIVDGTELEARLLNADGATQFDGAFTNRARIRAQAGSLRLQHRPSAMLQLTALAGRSRDDSENFLDRTFRTRFDTQRDSLSVQADWSLASSALLTSGFDYLRDRVASTTAYTVDSRIDRGVFVQYDGSAGRHQLTGGLRHDDDQQFGDRVTGNLAYGIELAPDLELIASGGTAFKAPTLNELYFPGFGNPDLGVERARSLELGLERTHTAGGWSLRAFGNVIDDLVSFDASTRRAQNIAAARVLGLELEGSWRREPWLARASLTLIDPENRGPGAHEGNVLPRRAQQSARVEVGRHIGRWDVGAVLVAAGRRFDDLANTSRLDGYATVDVMLAWRVAPAFVVRGRIGNLFNTHYQTASFFNQDTRHGWLNVEYTPF